MEINLDPPKQPKCINCGKESGKHKAFGMNCPLGRSRSFPSFYLEQFFERKEDKPKESDSRNG